MHTFTLAGRQFLLRPFTEAEAWAFSDKETAASRAEERTPDVCDDGDDEVLDCIQSPDRAAVLTFLEEYPAATADIAEEIWRISGSPINLRERPATQEELDTHKRPDGKPKFLLCLEVRPPSAAPGSAPLFTVVLEKLGRVAFKFLSHSEDAKRRKRISFAAMAKVAKESVLAGLPDAWVWEKMPALSIGLGMALVARASAKAGAAAKKEEPASLPSTTSST